MKKLLALVIAIMMMFTVTLSASAAPFVESIENKGVPEMIVVDNVDGNDVVGYVTDKDGNKLSTEFLDCFITYPLKDALDENSDMPDDIREGLINAYDELRGGDKTLSELCPELDEIVKDKWGADKSADDLVVKDLFELDESCEDLKKHLSADGTTIDLTFKVGIEAGSFITAMVYVDGKWKPVADCINNGDGTVTVKFSEICPVAFLVPGSGQNMDVVSPITADATDAFIWGAVMVIALGAIFALIVYRRKVNG